MRNGTRQWLDTGFGITAALRAAFDAAKAEHAGRLTDLPTTTPWPSGLERRGDRARHDGYDLYYEDGTTDEILVVSWKIQVSHEGRLHAVGVLGLSWQHSREVYLWVKDIDWPDLVVDLDVTLQMAPLVPIGTEIGIFNVRCYGPAGAGSVTWGTPDEARTSQTKLHAALTASLAAMG